MPKDVSVYEVQKRLRRSKYSLIDVGLDHLLPT